MGERVLFISIDGMTDALGQSQAIPYLEGLSKQGFSITIISCEKKNNFEMQGRKVEERLHKAGIAWRHINYSRSIPLVSQRGNLARLEKLAADFAKEKKGAFIAHCRSYLPAMIGLKLKKKYGAKFLFDMRGFWADERVEGKIWKLKNPLHKAAYRFFKKKEKELLSQADHIVSLTERAKDIITEQKKTSAPVSVIPCCVDMESFSIADESEKARTRKELGIGSTAFVWGYLGSIGTWYMLDEMLAFFKIALAKNPDSMFFFVTTENREQIEKYASVYGIPEKKLLIRSAGRDEVPAFLGTFDAGIFFIRPTFSKQASSPTKMAELLACGIPVLTNAGVGDTEKIITETNCGVFVKDFSDKSYEDAYSAMISHQKTKKELRSVAQNYFSLTDGIDSYNRIYRSLLP